MKISIPRGTLLPALNSAASVVDGKIIPIIGCLRMDVEGSELRMTATDLDLRISHEIEVKEGAESGSVCVEAGRLADIVRRLPDGAQVSISADKKKAQCRVSSGESKYTLPTLPVEEFPDASTNSVAQSFTIPAQILGAMLAKVKHCQWSVDSTSRPALIGVHLAASATHFYAEASDMHRLARAAIPVLEGMTDFKRVIVPRKTVELFIATLKGTGDAIVSLSDRGISVTAGQTCVMSKVVDAEFPDCDRVIPPARIGSISLDRLALVKAVERLNAFHRDEIRGKRCITVTAKDGALRLSVDGALGDGAETIPASSEGSVDTFGISPQYLLETLAVLEGKTLTLRITGGYTPILLDDGTENIHLISLMRV